MNESGTSDFTSDGYKLAYIVKTIINQSEKWWEFVFILYLRWEYRSIDTVRRMTVFMQINKYVP